MRLYCLLLFIALSVSGQTITRKTVCASGCDYPNTFTGLQAAVNDAASSQSSSCAPYLIEIDPANPVDLNGGTIILAPKTCAQYVRIRSMRMGDLPADGTRVDTSSGSLARIQSTMPKPSGFYFVGPNAKTRYWAFEGLDLYGNSGNGINAYAVLLQLAETDSTFPASVDPGLRADHFEVKHCWIHGVPGKLNVANGVGVGSNNVLIADNVIEDISVNGSEGHAVAITWTDGPVTLLNNVIDSSTENTIVGGTISPAGNLPSFVRFIGNKYTKKGYYKVSSSTSNPNWACRPGNVHKNTATGHDWTCSGGAPGTWTDTGGTGNWGSGYSVKNLWEAKLGRGLRIYANDFSGMWYPSAQGGETFVLNLVASTTGGNPPWLQPHDPFKTGQPWTTMTDVFVGDNTLHDGLAMMSLAYPVNGVTGITSVCAINAGLSVPPWCLVNAHNNIRFYDNLATNMSDERDYNKGDCCSPGSGANGGGFVMGENTGDFNIDFRHNTYLLSTTSPNSGQLNKMIIPGPDPTEKGYNNFRDNITPAGLHTVNTGSGGECGWQTALSPTGTDDLRGNTIITDGPWGSYSFSTGPACSASDRWPVGTNAAKTNAMAVDASFHVQPAYQKTASDGRDPGADVDHVNWASAGAVTGAWNPALEYKLRSAMRTQTTAKVYFTAPSDNDCTWELSPDGDGYSSSVPVGVQTRNGRDGIAEWSGLAPGQVYFARSTCDGLKLEQTVDGRRFMFITAP